MKIAIAAALLSLQTTSFGQGQVYFNNRVTGTQTTGPQASVDAPVLGVGGVRNIVGTGWTIQLWGALNSTYNGNEANLVLVPASTTTFRTSSSGAGYMLAGLTVAIPGTGVGDVAALQMRAWDNKGGTLTTWEQALAGFTSYGKSAVITSFPLGGGTVQPPNMVGLQGFTVPEPSSLAFLVAGWVSLLALRRRK